MRAETYKGIEFIRISEMPHEQRALLHQTLDKSKIIKILREHELLNDCILVTDFIEWSAANIKVEKEPTVLSQTVTEMRLAFK